MAIGEFAEFTDRPTASGGAGRGGGLWRAQLGQTWHEQLRRSLAERDPAAEFEVTISARWPHQHWTFQLQGRADQVVRGPVGVTIREVKTVDFPLPAHDLDLAAAYPGYFLQLQAYQRLYPLTEGREAGEVRAELIFVEIQTGMTQTVPVEAGTADPFLVQVERIYRFLETRHDHLLRLREFRHRPPFAEARPGQETIAEEITAAAASQPVLLFEAPTGFGKTGVMLDHALQRLQSGAVTRIIFLTSKSTGQIQAAAQLRQMLGGQPTVSFVQIRNKGEHCVNTVFHCFRDVCTYLHDLEERWEKSGLARALTSPGEPLELSLLREAGRNIGVCPYEITRAMLPLVDIWIGDYNYVFAPGNRGLFFNQPGFSAGETLLIIDEAHNLPSRVCDTFSASLSVTRCVRTVSELELAATPGPVLMAWERLLDTLAQIEPADALPAPVEADLRAAVGKVCDTLLENPLDYPSLGPDLSDRLMEMFNVRQALENEQVERLVWSPRRGEVLSSCLSAAAYIAETVRAFPEVAMMSATFGPHETFAEACGLAAEEFSAVSAHAPWRASACDVAIDLRVDTRLRTREKHYGTTAATVARIADRSPGPIVVFFSSYRYAEAVQRRMEDDFPSVRVALQERGLDLRGQTAFVEENLVLANALFFILGSSYAESIDLLGGRIAYAVVVGPALPEVNALQKARMNKLAHLSHEEAFHAVYQIPAMQRVNQALGRLVRAPGQRTRILLHCQRFAEKSYGDLLHPDHRTQRYLFTEEEVENWLSSEEATAETG